MKKYIKPITDIHQIAPVLMQPTSVPTDNSESFSEEEQVGARGFTFFEESEEE